MEGGFTKNSADAERVSFLWKKIGFNGLAENGRGVEKGKKTTAICHGCQQPLSREHRAFRRMAAVVALAIVVGLTPIPAAADGAPVVISEIAAFESSDHEWIEVVNRSDLPVDLAGWKFFEDGANHGLTLTQGSDMALEPGEYAIIADVTTNFIIDYPNYDGTLFDSSWSTLNEDGEPIALKDATGAVVEMFTYLPTTDHSIERINITKDDYTIANWIENQNGPTPGATYQPQGEGGETGSNDDADLGDSVLLGTTNEEGTLPQDDDNPTLSGTSSRTEGTTETQTELQDANEESGSAERATPGSVVINEFVADPASGGNEWIELWNRTDFLLDLHAWKLEDGAGTIRTLNVLVGPGPHVVELTTSKLNNSGDLIVLSDALGTAIDSVAYGSWDDGNASDNAPAPDDGEAVGRSPNASGTFAVLSAPTPGAANSEPAAPAVTENQPTTTSSGTNLPIPPAPKSMMIISEIMPNPAGGDEDEWIELGNIGTAAADLNRWTVGDGVTTYFLDGRVISPGSFLVLPRSETNIALENSGLEKLTLRDASRKLLATVSYADAGENLSYALDEFGDWRWTKKSTPGASNEINSPNAPPSAAIYASNTGLVGELLLFDATDSVDPEGSRLVYRWDFGDGTIGERSRTLHAFGSAGKHRITLVVSDADGTIATKNVTVTIKSTAAVKPAAASEISPSVKPGSVKTAVAKKKTTSQKTTQTRATTIGAIIALPGVLNKRTFLIETDSGPTEIYLHTASFPSLSLGDRISATGRWSERKGLRRLLVSETTDIIAVERGDELQPMNTSVADLSPEDEGRLVSISGEIVEKTRLGLILSEGGGELTIAKPPEGWPSDVAVGSRVTVAGIALGTPQGLKILPRNAEDILVDSPSPEPAEERARPPPGPPPLAAGLPAAVAALGVSAGSAVLIRRKRGKSTSTPH